jgi:hypothetical protein
VEGSTGCIDYIQTKLVGEGATDWVALYDERGCDSCENASRCVSQPPICIPTGEPCVGASLASDASCCAYDPDNVTKSYCGPSNVCSTNARCKPLESCEADTDCCGGDAGPLLHSGDRRGRLTHAVSQFLRAERPSMPRLLRVSRWQTATRVHFNFENPPLACEDLHQPRRLLQLASGTALVNDFFVYVCKPLDAN